MSTRGCSGLLMILLVAVAACDSGLSVGAVCTQGTDCASGRCETFAFEGVCTDTCDGDADCAGGLRCMAHPPTGERLCRPPCNGSYDPGFVCVDGALVACADAGAAWNCGDCGCPANQYCDGDGPSGCKPDRAVGEPCERNDECASNNCSRSGERPLGYCQVPRGAACTSDNCASCDRTPEGSTCAQTCSGGGVCTSDEACIGNRDVGQYSCRANCNPFDAATCAYGWLCQAIDINTYVRWLCSPSETCVAGVTGCRGETTCTALPGTDYSICAPTCSPFNPTCPAGWTCSESGTWYACLPQSR